MVQDNRTPGGRGRSSRRPTLREDTTNREPKTSAYTAHQQKYAAGPRQTTPGAVGNDVPSPHRPKVQNYLDRLHGMRESQRQRLFPSQDTQPSGGGQSASPPAHKPSKGDHTPGGPGGYQKGPNVSVDTDQDKIANNRGGGPGAGPSRGGAAGPPGRYKELK